MQAPNSLQLFEANRWLERTGIEGQVVDMIPLRHGYTHRNDLLTLQEGAQIVLRRYLHRGLAPARKERAFYGLLRHQAEVPAPRVIGILSTDEASALVMEYINGPLLGDVAANLPDGPFEDVHRSVGAALKRMHRIHYRIGGILVGEDLFPFAEGSWGAYLLAEVKRDLQSLVDSRLLGRTLASTIQERFTAAVPMLNDHTPTLVHGDFHPWNLLVTLDNDSWSLRAVVDLESAVVGDPCYDLARFTAVRFGPYPTIPNSFWEAYGKRPDAKRLDLYVLHTMLGAAKTRGTGGAMATHWGEQALAFLRALQERFGAASV